MILMGTTARITIVGESAQAEAAIFEAFSLLKEYEKKMNFHSPDSELSKINKLAGKNPVKVSGDTIAIIQKAINYSMISEGAFDVTATSLHQRGGYGNIVIDPKQRTVYFKDPETRIDFGGIFVGFCLDRIAERFKQAGIDNFLVDIGGDIIAQGKNAQGKFWRVGIRNPFNRNELIENISLRNEAVTTSGNYLRQHIIDFERDRLLNDDILSVTVISQKCIEADALATAFFVMGQEAVEEFLKENTDIKTVLVINNNRQPKVIKINFQN